MFYLLLFLQHLMLCLMQNGLLIHFVVGMDLINALDFDSIELADEWEVVVKDKEKPRMILKMLAQKLGRCRC